MRPLRVQLMRALAFVHQMEWLRCRDSLSGTLMSKWHPSMMDYGTSTLTGELEHRASTFGDFYDDE